MSRTPDPPDFKPRMTAPACLSDAEKKVWKSLVNSVSTSHFERCDAPLLVEYCRAIVLADEAAAGLRNGAVVNGKTSPWLIIQEKTTRAIVALSMRLRLSPQGRIDPKKASTSARQGISQFDDDDDPDDLLAKPSGLASFGWPARMPRR